MHLLDHLQHTFPEQNIVHKNKGHYHIFESERFRMNVSAAGNHFRVHFLQAKPQGIQYGNALVSVLLEYCRKSRLVPYVSEPDNYKNFWRRNGFEPTMEDDGLWIHEDWNE